MIIRSDRASPSEPTIRPPPEPTIALPISKNSIPNQRWSLPIPSQRSRPHPQPTMELPIPQPAIASPPKNSPKPDRVSPQKLPKTRSRSPIPNQRQGLSSPKKRYCPPSPTRDRADTILFNFIKT